MSEFFAKKTDRILFTTMDCDDQIIVTFNDEYIGGTSINQPPFVAELGELLRPGSNFLNVICLNLIDNTPWTFSFSIDKNGTRIPGMAPPLSGTTEHRGFARHWGVRIICET